jgi:membrane protease YdiL (CAAX protease family)
VASQHTRLSATTVYDGAVNSAEPELPRNTLCWALSFEVGLGVMALLLGKVFGVWPVQSLNWPVSTGVVGLGICAAFPLLWCMLHLRRLKLPAIVELNELVEQQVVPIFGKFSLIQLLMISAAAGWGEELLFRGFIQADLAQRFSPAAAILLSSLLFGMMHPFSRTYFALATATSVYLGWLFSLFETIWVPILAHGVYDFLMLVVLTSRGSAKPPSTVA